MRNITMADLNKEVTRHLREGNKIQAIKSLREAFPEATLIATKLFVESIDIRRTCPCCGEGQVSNELFQKVIRDAKASGYENLIRA